jgi:hypothetical protein
VDAGTRWRRDDAVVPNECKATVTQLIDADVIAGGFVQRDATGIYIGTFAILALNGLH